MQAKKLDTEAACLKSLESQARSFQLLVKDILKEMEAKEEERGTSSYKGEHRGRNKLTACGFRFAGDRLSRFGVRCLAGRGCTQTFPRIPIWEGARAELLHVAAPISIAGVVDGRCKSSKPNLNPVTHTVSFSLLFHAPRRS